MTFSAPALARREFRAMGTEITLLCPQSARAATLLDRAELWLGAYERRLSRFIPYSELSRLNASAGRPFHASPLLFTFVDLCLRLAQESNGVFNPTLLRQIEAAGYDRTFARLPAVNTLRPLARSGRLEEIELDRIGRTILLPKDMGIDSGGLGKGWAADHLTRILGLDCLIDCGGDIAAAGKPGDAAAWYVGVQDPFEPDTDVGTIAVSDRGVATSSVLKRRWLTNQGPAHHLIDSRTGQPSKSDVAAVTVVAKNATLADFYAKVALLKGAAEGLTYLESAPYVEGLLISLDQTRSSTSGFRAHLAEA